MKDFLKYVPGFRSDKLWKKIIASFYYFTALTALADGIGLFLFALSLPLIFFSIANLLKTRKNGISKPAILSLVVSLVISSAGLAMIPPVSDGIDTDNMVVEQEQGTKDDLKVARADVDDKQVDLPKTSVVNAEKAEESKEPENKTFKGEKDLKVHFIDVGQGDSIFIELPNNENVLIDGGPGANKDHLMKYLKELKFETINYLVATHPHEDHIGGLPEVIRTFNIGKVYMPNATHTTKIFEELLTTIQSKDLSVIQTETDTILLDEPGLKLKALAPDPNTSGNNFNDYSIVLRLDYNDNSFMFTGDGETLTEQYLLADNSDAELKVDVLKVGHHGSDTSTTQPFIEKVKPKYSVISCGKGNSYGHPTPNVIARLESFNTEIYRTDTDGTIVATADGEKISFVKKGNPIEPNAPPEKTQAKEEPKQESKAEEKVSTPVPSNTNNSSGNSSTGASTQTGQGEVFITKTGSKYHRRACGRGNYFAASLSEAKSRGLEPCKKCY